MMYKFFNLSSGSDFCQLPIYFYFDVFYVNKKSKKSRLKISLKSPTRDYNHTVSVLHKYIV